MSSRTKIGLAVLLSIGLAIFFFIKIILSLSNPLYSCYSSEQFRQLAPDKKHEFGMNNQLCAGGFGQGSNSYWITLYDSTRPADAGIKVFAASNLAGTRAPVVNWTDSEHIRITVLQICQVYTSLHKAGSIEVTYHLADELREENFAKRMNEFERQRKEAASKGLTSDARNPGALRKSIEFAWMQYRKLKEWADANVDN
jgi:hypothetical protein